MPIGLNLSSFIKLYDDRYFLPSISLEMSMYLFSIDDCTNFRINFLMGGDCLSTENLAFEDFTRLPLRL